MRRVTVLVLGAIVLALASPSRADEPDPEKVARIIEEIKAHRAEKDLELRAKHGPTNRPPHARPPEPRRRGPAPRPAGGGER